LTVDHAVPRSARNRSVGAETAEGRVADQIDHPDNLVAACFSCNRAKWDLVSAEDPVTGRQQPLFNPRQQVWGDHFSWANRYQSIVGLTPVGRATVKQLQLNREVYRRQRAILRAAARGGADPWP
jgi:hypothetical protein